MRNTLVLYTHSTVAYEKMCKGVCRRPLKVQMVRVGRLVIRKPYGDANNEAFKTDRNLFLKQVFS